MTNRAPTGHGRPVGRGQACWGASWVMANPRPRDGIPTDPKRSARGIDAAACPAEITCESRDGKMARRRLRTEWSEGQAQKGGRPVEDQAWTVDWNWQPGTLPDQAQARGPVSRPTGANPSTRRTAGRSARQESERP